MRAVLLHAHFTYSKRKGIVHIVDVFNLPDKCFMVANSLWQENLSISEIRLSIVLVFAVAAHR